MPEVSWLQELVDDSLACTRCGHHYCTLPYRQKLGGICWCGCPTPSKVIDRSGKAGLTQ